MSESVVEVMTSADVAEWLHETVKTVDTWARAGKIPGHKIGKRWKFIRSEVEAAVQAA
jgi:excisionase family DNA binding protein